MKKEDNKDKIIAKTGVAAGTTMAGLGGAMSLGAKNQAEQVQGYADVPLPVAEVRSERKIYVRRSHCIAPVFRASS